MNKEIDPLYCLAHGNPTICLTKHPKYGELFVFTDYKGIFLDDLETARYYLKELQKTYKKISQEDIRELSKLNLLHSHPGMYTQCFEDKPKSITEEEFEQLFSQRQNYYNEAKKEKQKGYVYFIKQGKYTKIGRSSNPTERMKQMEIATPEPLILTHTVKTNDCVQCEEYFQKKYKKFRIRGEWFSLNDEQLEETKNIREKNFQKITEEVNEK